MQPQLIRQQGGCGRRFGRIPEGRTQVGTPSFFSPLGEMSKRFWPEICRIRARPANAGLCGSYRSAVRDVWLPARQLRQKMGFFEFQPGHRRCFAHVLISAWHRSLQHRQGFSCHETGSRVVQAVAELDIRRAIQSIRSWGAFLSCDGSGLSRMRFARGRSTHSGCIAMTPEVSHIMPWPIM